MLHTNYKKYLQMFRHPKPLFISMILILFSFNAFSQGKGIKITGVITDTHKQPLVGVTVRVKYGQAGTSTDIDGKYAITVPDNSAILAFGYVGFVPQEQAVKDQSVLNVTLVEKSTGLNEVVVVAYGTSKKKDLTGSVGQASISDMTKAPVISIDQALAGRVAGVQVSSSDGQPGSAVNIVIRGANSITQDNSPLYVVDGFPIEGFNLNTFNPQDIESIDVLKDASSTALYGARGANGVIIITTKKGKVGSPVTTFTTTQSFSKNVKTMQLMNSYDFLKYQLELTPGLGTALAPTPTYTYLTVPGKTLDDYKNYPTTDWQSHFLKQVA